ncbi:MAG: DUF1674 domain-containing protein [Kiloniellales bacterium]|nr:DUF1674 domain-containing protein [Kiloniellales bacterium]
MSKDFKAHVPAPAKTARRKAPAPEAPPRRIGPAELEAAARAKADTKGKPGEKPTSERPREIGGPEGPEPTRYGDWERKGICVDF